MTHNNKLQALARETMNNLFSHVGYRVYQYVCEQSIIDHFAAALKTYGDERYREGLEVAADKYERQVGVSAARLSGYLHMLRALADEVKP